jgi:hypothetical protein
VIRVTDTGFDEQVLFDQDAVLTEILQRPEFQKRMTTTERNYLLGKQYGEREKALGVAPGLLSTCAELELPVFIGAPADGSGFLNSVKLWTLARLGKIQYGFDYDLHEDVFESCAYHHWGLFDSDAKSLAILILGGGVPKNYSLQPEPTLSQIFFLENIRGYDYDAQIVSSPVTDGSLSSCAPGEAVSWGKVNPETYTTQTRVHLGHHLEGVGDIDHVGLAAGPAAVGVERDGAALADEAPAHHVRLFAVAAGGEALGVARRCAGLADLVQVREEGKHGVALRRPGRPAICCCRAMRRRAQEAEDQFAGLGGVNLAVGLLLGPAGAGDEQQLGVGADGLRVLRRRAEAADRGAQRGELDCDLLDLRGAGSPAKARACRRREAGTRGAHRG